MKSVNNSAQLHTDCFYFPETIIVRECKEMFSDKVSAEKTAKLTHLILTNSTEWGNENQ